MNPPGSIANAEYEGHLDGYDLETWMTLLLRVPVGGWTRRKHYRSDNTRQPV